MLTLPPSVRVFVHLDPFAYLRDVISRACDPNFTGFAQLTPIAGQAARQTSLEA